MPEVPTAAWSTGGDSEEDEEDAGKNDDEHVTASSSSESSKHSESSESVSSTSASSGDNDGNGLARASAVEADASPASVIDEPLRLGEDAKQRWPSGAEGREARMVAEAQEVNTSSGFGN